MRPALVSVLAATLSALSVLAQRHDGGGGGDFPSTFITITSAVPAATPDPSLPSAPSSSGETSSAGSSSAGASSGGSSGSVDASLIPPFGITAGVKANDGTANCVGDGGKDIP
jgi:hypothetical protein